jgi:hypothetical protein
MKQQLNEVQALQKIAGIKSESDMPVSNVDPSKFLNKDEVPGEEGIEEGMADIRASIKKQDEKAARLQKVWDSLKGVKFTHKNDRKKIVYTVSSVNYPTTNDGKAVLSGYPNNWDFFLTLNWKGRKSDSMNYFKLNHAVANFKDGTWIPVK